MASMISTLYDYHNESTSACSCVTQRGKSLNLDQLAVDLSRRVELETEQFLLNLYYSELHVILRRPDNILPRKRVDAMIATAVRPVQRVYQSSH